ncbi:unnamed protein product [Calicophoron daubneyi]|uniref:Beta-1,4-galactosyltransferase n=1 Tax=Calicophoron daubneyi TaxID=300641 RepID=A0AAV2TQB3_CALDB
MGYEFEEEMRNQRLSQRRIAEGLLLIFIVFIILSLLAQLFSSHVHYRSKYPESSLNLVPVGGWEPCDLGRDSNPLLKEQHRLAVLVPFRDRFTELQQFLPHLDRFLTDQNVVHTFYIINQVDDFRFNRGALLNVGVLDSFKAETEGVKIENPLSHSSPPRRTHCYRLPSTDYLALHDVDLLPVDQALRYTWPTGTGPVHLLPAEIHPRYYWYKYYFGGVVLIRRVEFKDIDGMSNLFWGWGAEDDEFSLRIKRAGLKVSKPVDVTMGMNAFKIIHNEVRHVRDGQTYYDPRVRKLLRNPTGGLSTANYSVDSRRLIQISGVPALVVNVRLACNVDVDLCIESSKRLPDEPKEKS